MTPRSARPNLRARCEALSTELADVRATRETEVGEAADTLYGVTMQEPGVSKLVSVNLSKLGAKKTASGSVGSHPTAVA